MHRNFHKYILKLTPSLEVVIRILENEGPKIPLTGSKDGKIYIIETNSVEIIRTEERELILYNRK